MGCLSLQSFSCSAGIFCLCSKGILTDVTQNYSLIWHIHCFLKLNPNDPHITGVAICFHEFGCSDNRLNISLGKNGKKILFPNNILIPYIIKNKITLLLLLLLLIKCSVFLVGECLSDCFEPLGLLWWKSFNNLL